MKRTCTRVLRSALSLVLVFCLSLSLCGAAFATESSEINYVSIGDSMANGYGFAGYNQTSDDRNVYDFMTGKGMYGNGAYPLQFEEYLKGQGYTVNHTKLATSAMLAEDLLYLLGGREEFDDGWGGYKDYVGTYTDAELMPYIQDAVTDADVITMGIGNASFGAFMLHKITDALGVFGASLEEDEKVNFEDSIAVLELDDEQYALVMQVYDMLETKLIEYVPAELVEEYNLNDVVDLLAYTTATYVVNYKLLVEQILEMNSDVEIVLVGLLNTTYGMNVTDENGNVILPFGDAMDMIFGILNAYMAGLPAVMQAMGVAEDANLYYAEQPNPLFICQEFEALLENKWVATDERLDGGIIRERNIDAFNGSLGYMIGMAVTEAPLANITLADVKAYEALDWDALQANYGGYGYNPWAAFIFSGYMNGLGLNAGVPTKTPTEAEIKAATDKILAVSIYLAIEEAVARNTNTMDIPLEGLMTIAGDLSSVFTGLGTPPDDSPEDTRTWLFDGLNGPVTGGMCKIYGLFKVGNGMSVHPTPAGHDNIAAAVITAYKNHTVKDETIENVEVTLEALYDVLVTYGPEVAAEVWNQWVEYGYVESVEETMGELEEMLTARYEYYTTEALPAIEGAVGELAAQKDALCAELETLNAELAAKKAELEKVISEQEIGSVTLPEISIDVELGNNDQTEVPEHECVVESVSIEAELEAAIADLEHAIAVIEALITDIEADIADMVALAEQIAAAVAELEKTMADIAAAAEDLAAAVEAAINVLMDNEGIVDAVIKSFNAARATVLAANDVLELTLGVAEEIIADIDEMVGMIAEDAEALYNKFLEDLPGCIDQIPEEGQMLIGGAIMAAQMGLEEGKALIEEKLAEELAALEAEYGMSEEEILAELEALAAEYGISEESIRAELEAIYTAIEAEAQAQYAAVEEQLKADIAALEAEAAAQIEALEAEKAALEAQLAEAAEDAIEGIQAQIDRVTGDIATVNEDLACAIEHLENAAQIAYEEIVAEVTAAYEAAIAELEKALADLEAAYNEAVAALEAELAALKEAYDKAVDELTAAADKAIADLTAKIEEQLAELDKIGEELGQIIDQIYAEIHDELEAAQTAIKEILKGNLEAIEDLTNALVELGAESVIDLVESIVAQIEAMFEEATTDDYVITPDSYYVAIGDGSAETESYVEELAAYLGIDYTNLAEDGQEMADAYGVIADNAADIAAADLITIGYSNSTFAVDAFNAAVDGADLDWSTYVTDAGVAYVDDVLADISAELAANGITGDYNSRAVDAIEAYAYSSVAYACNLPGVVSAIREVNEDAVVIIVGQHNAFAGTTLAFEGVEIDLGEYVDYLVTGAAVYGIGYCMITGDAIYVEAPDAATDMPAEIGMDTLIAFMRGDFSVLYPNATGDLYIRDKILNALNITTEGLLGDANSDGVVNTLDARVIMMYNVGLDVDINLSVCDVNFDGSVNTLDARAIMMYNVGLITEFKPL